MTDYTKILDALEKQHRIVSGNTHSLDRLSSGMLVPDLISGGGLLPGIHSISGPEQSAKCIIGSSLVTLDGGETIRIDDPSIVGKMVYTHLGRLRKVTHHHKSWGKTLVITIRDSQGKTYEIEGLGDHKLYSFEPNNQTLEFRRFDNLTTYTLVPLPAGSVTSELKNRALVPGHEQAKTVFNHFLHFFDKPDFQNIYNDIFYGHFTYIKLVRFLTKIEYLLSLQLVTSSIDPIVLSQVRTLQNYAQFDWAEVISIETGSYQNVFDITVEEDHSYVANGVITHNSTQTFHVLKSAISNKVPVIIDYDAEGAVHREYLSSIFGVKDISMIFGKKDAKGKYLLEPKARYIQENVLEDFFRFVRDILRVLPEKIYLPEHKQWFLVYDDSKTQKAVFDASGHKAVKSLSSRGMTYVEAPDTAPQALIILDSWPQLMPEKFDEEEGGGSGMALKARIMSEELQKTAGQIRKKGVILYGVNQIRLKPGVMYGCFTYETPVLLADGTTLPIGYIVDNKMEVEVMSYNKDTDTFEPKKVVNWFNNGVGEVDEFRTIRIIPKADQNDGPNYTINVTANHIVLTTSGEKRVGELRYNDKIITKDVPSLAVVSQAECLDNLTKYDLEVEGNHCYVVGGSNGIVVHNSPEYEPCGEALKFSSHVRNQIKARQVPPTWGKGKVSEEQGVDGGVDTYAFKHMTNIKNKFGTPFLNGWMRVWVSDSKGKAHGFDPVFDTFEYLKQTGQVEGSQNKKFTVKLNDKKMTLDWAEFKSLILSEDQKTPSKDLLKLFKSNKMKPFKLRKECFKQLKSGEGTERLSVTKSSGSMEEDLED